MGKIKWLEQLNSTGCLSTESTVSIDCTIQNRSFLLPSFSILAILPEEVRAVSVFRATLDLHVPNILETYDFI